MSQNLVNIYDDGLNLAAEQIEYNRDLDYWDGSNYQNGGVGRHLGIAQTRSGQMVLIYSSDYLDRKPYALYCTDLDAIAEIVHAEKYDLLKKFNLDPYR